MLLLLFGIIIGLLCMDNLFIYYLIANNPNVKVFLYRVYPSMAHKVRCHKAITKNQADKACRFLERAHFRAGVDYYIRRW